MQMRNVGSVKSKAAGGAKLGARFDVRGTNNPTSLFRATGPMALITFGAKPHVIPRRRRGRKGFVAFNGVVRRSVNHPGTSGKDTWRKGRKAGEKPTMDRLRKSLIDVVRAA